MKKERLSILLALVLIFILCSCGSSSTYYHLMVYNNTGVAIGDIRMVGEGDDADYWFENLLEEELPDGGSADLANTVDDSYAENGLRMQFFTPDGELPGGEEIRQGVICQLN